MQVYGVGKEGGYITVNNEVVVHIEYGNYFYLDQNTGEFVYVRPQAPQPGYKEGAFYEDEGIGPDGKLKLKKEAEVESVKDVELEKVLKAALSSDGLGDSGDYKIIKNEPTYKSGYFYRKISILGLEIRGYFALIFTRCNSMYSLEASFATPNHSANEKYIEKFLNEINIVSEEVQRSNNKIIKESRVKVDEPDFTFPKYDERNEIKLDAFSLVLPDGYEYVSKKHPISDKELQKELLSNYELVAAPKEIEGGLGNYKDAALGINIVKPSVSNLDPRIWEHTDEALAGKIEASNNGADITFIKGDKNYLVAYGRGNECKSYDDPYWVVYYVIIFYGNQQQMCNLYFNSKRTDEEDYEKAIRDFCAGIVFNSDSKSNKTSVEKLNAVKMAQLYSKDVIFHNDDEISVDGDRTLITGLQLNAELINDYPEILNNAQAFVNGMKEIYEYLEDNEKLRVTREKMHEEIFKATRNYPLTGSLIFELCAWHMIVISESGDNSYMVALDTNLLKGIPDAYSYIGEFIKSLRNYNEITDDFTVSYVLTTNLDSPCEAIENPVEGAVVDGSKTINVKGKSLSIKKKYTVDAPVNTEKKSIIEQRKKQSDGDKLEDQNEKKLKDELKKLDEEKKKLLTKEAEYQNRISSLRRDIEKETPAEKEQRELNISITQLTIKRDGLGFLKFKEKKMIEGQIKELSERVSLLEKDIEKQKEEQKSKITPEIDAVSSELSPILDRIKEIENKSIEIDNELFVIRKKQINKNRSGKLTAVQRENESLKREIVNVLVYSNRNMTAKEIAGEIGISTAKCSAVLQFLTNEEYVDKIKSDNNKEMPLYHSIGGREYIPLE